MTRRKNQVERRLQIQEVRYIAGKLRSANQELILQRVIPAVELEQHLQYYPDRMRLWRWWKEKEKLATLVSHMAATFSSLLASFSTGKERYARFLAAWYQSCGTTACPRLASESSRETWKAMIDGYERDVLPADRSALVHAVGAALFGALAQEVTSYTMLITSHNASHCTDSFFMQMKSLQAH